MNLDKFKKGFDPKIGLERKIEPDLFKEDDLVRKIIKNLVKQCEDEKTKVIKRLIKKHLNFKFTEKPKNDVKKLSSLGYDIISQSNCARYYKDGKFIFERIYLFKLYYKGLWLDSDYLIDKFNFGEDWR